MTTLQGYTIVFDLDGTLIDTAPDLIGATTYALAARGLGPANALRQRQFISFGARRMIVEALRDCGQAALDKDVDQMHGQFIAYYEANIARQSRPYLGMLEALHALRAAGAKLAVCTNKREALARQLLCELALDGQFVAIAGLETFPVSKPHPGHILGTIRLACGDAARAIMVGDSENDIKAARAAGVPSVGCTFGYSDAPMQDLRPDAMIGAYSELHDAIANLACRPVGS